MISVIMPVYNASQFLQKAIESILYQTEKDFELIIINDGSTDDSEAIINTYNDSRIRYFKKENGGEASARNFGLAIAVGEFIVWQDADDLSMPNRLEKLKEGFFSDAVDFVHSDMFIINESDRILGCWQTEQINPKKMLRHLLKIGTPFNNASMMLRKKILTNLQFNENYKIGTDTDMVSQALLTKQGIHVAEPLLLYRMHGNNATRHLDYQKTFVHVQDFVRQHTLTELIPETTSVAKAEALLAYFLFHRQMTKDAMEYLEMSKKEIKNDNEKKFVSAIENLIQKEFKKAIVQLLSVKDEMHLVYNYLGEAQLYLGELDKSQKYLEKSLSIKPDYSEPMDNLQAIGYKNGVNPNDKSWVKFF